MKNQELERLRGISILLVLLCHLNFHYRVFWMFAYGWIGVDFFFVLSGYVVTRSWRRRYLELITAPEESLSLKAKVRFAGTFLFRRILRLWPSCLVWSVGLLLPAYFLNEYRRFPSPASVQDALSWIWTFTFHHRVKGVLADPMTYFYSLTLEETFYLGLPFLLLLSSRARNLLALTTGAVLMIWMMRLFSSHFPGFARSALVEEFIFPIYRRDLLLLGVAIALFQETFQSFSFVWLRSKRIKLVIATLSWILLGIALCFPIARKLWLPFHYLLPTGIAVSLVVLSVIHSGGTFSLGRWNFVLECLGSRAYTIYLCHLPVLWTVRSLCVAWGGRELHWATTISLWILLLVPCVEISYRVLERPFLSRRSDWRSVSFSQYRRAWRTSLRSSGSLTTK